MLKAGGVPNVASPFLTEITTDVCPVHRATTYDV